MSTYIKVDGEVNLQYQVLVWKVYEVEDDEILGCPQIEYSFDTYDQAVMEYNKHGRYLCKQLIEYESAEPNSDGDILCEDWNEDYVDKWHVCQDGDKWYIQADPESEEWIAEFNSEAQADEYVKFLESGK